PTGGGGGNVQCPQGNSSAGSVTCQPFATNWVIHFSDLNRPLTFSATDVSGANHTQTVPAHPSVLQFVTAGVGINFPSFGNPTPLTTGPILVLFPCISVTKVCDTNCFPYGSLITFHGTVSNDSDTNTILTRITVTDSL